MSCSQLQDVAGLRQRTVQSTCTVFRVLSCRTALLLLAVWLQAMNSNYFLWIIVVVSVLAVMSKLTGAI